MMTYSMGLNTFVFLLMLFASNASWSKQVYNIKSRDGGDLILSALREAKPALPTQADGSIRSGLVTCSARFVAVAVCTFDHDSKNNSVDWSEVSGRAANNLAILLKNIKKKTFPGYSLEESDVTALVCTSGADCTLVLEINGGARRGF